MAFIRPYRAISLRPSTRIIRPSSSSIRPFTTSPSLRLKEDASRSPEEIDQKKHEQIDKQKKGEGHWHEELASSSESNIGADREHGKVEDHDDHMSDLQEQTAGQKEKEHPEGKAR